MVPLQRHRRRARGPTQVGGGDTCRHVSTRAACRQRCFPTPASNVTFVPMIRWGGLMGDCGEAVCGGDVPDQYQVGAAVGQERWQVNEIPQKYSQYLFKQVVKWSKQ